MTHPNMAQVDAPVQEKMREDSPLVRFVEMIAVPISQLLKRRGDADERWVMAQDFTRRKVALPEDGDADLRDLDESFEEDSLRPAV